MRGCRVYTRLADRTRATAARALHDDNAPVCRELHSGSSLNAFIDIRPFGEGVNGSLINARIQPDGTAIWEEEDYCSPPLAQERAAVLDAYFEEIKVEQVKAGEGWNRIKGLPKLDANNR